MGLVNELLSGIDRIEEDFLVFPRGRLEPSVEQAVVRELSRIFRAVVSKYQTMVEQGSAFPGYATVTALPEAERFEGALRELVERMEGDFVRKLAEAERGGDSKGLEIGQIKLGYLDAIRRKVFVQFQEAG